ncbi:MAG: PepSY domain-containing protein [Nitrospirales bacterium]|nr:PepSY domain-containing protein [Nitrospirales bacterium]
MRHERQKKLRMEVTRFIGILGFTVGLFGLLPPAYSDDDVVEYQRLKAEVVPVERVFQQVKSEFEGIILELELEDEESQWIYEVKLLTPQGNVLKIEYDAKTMDLLKIKGRQDHSP